MKYKKEDIISKWDTKLYNDEHSFVYDYGKSLIEILNPKKNERILDLGCGSGYVGLSIAKNTKIKKKEILKLRLKKERK